jgi:hypothetical protein
MVEERAEERVEEKGWRKRGREMGRRGEGKEEGKMEGRWRERGREKGRRMGGGGEVKGGGEWEGKGGGKFGGKGGGTGNGKSARKGWETYYKSGLDAWIIKYVPYTYKHVGWDLNLRGGRVRDYHGNRNPGIYDPCKWEKETLESMVHANEKKKPWNLWSMQMRRPNNAIIQYAISVHVIRV